MEAEYQREQYEEEMENVYYADSYVISFGNDIGPQYNRRMPCPSRPDRMTWRPSKANSRSGVRTPNSGKSDRSYLDYRIGGSRIHQYNQYMINKKAYSNLYNMH